MKNRPYRKYKNEDIILFAKEVISIAQLLHKLKLQPAGGNYANIKRKLQQLNVNCDHWKGQAWSKDEDIILTFITKLDE